MLHALLAFGMGFIVSRMFHSWVFSRDLERISKDLEVSLEIIEKLSKELEPDHPFNDRFKK